MGGAYDSHKPVSMSMYLSFTILTKQSDSVEMSVDRDVVETIVRLIESANKLVIERSKPTKNTAPTFLERSELREPPPVMIP